ncbi:MULTISPECIES: hypothetical protein [unclassified Polaribacter]|uniref:hypothetical protein n=1 Tax=unclassified Polaribacter TaxID=196858 RepID=UPI0011BE88FA|nr:MULTISPECIES: hypothetical protein [unclassified Polaribacter]TXD54075.1 hypothetical protein ES043_02125 [Polaribacter sp. IC063]TXD62591.1 hypothetical protein ES044_01155 [Polaribacter sp. IC066]
MKSIKRYFLLIFLALLPIYKLFHFDDYCFGDEDLLVVGVLTIVFVIVFITNVFNDLYTISFGKEMFNFKPLIIAGVFFTALFLGLKFHDKNFFKNEFQTFKSQKKNTNDVEIKLFGDATFEFKTTFSNYSCVQKGTYFYRKDSLFLNKTIISSKEQVFDSVYIFSKVNKLLISTDSLLPNFLLQKRL